MKNLTALLAAALLAAALLTSTAAFAGPPAHDTTPDTTPDVLSDVSAYEVAGVRPAVFAASGDAHSVQLMVALAERSDRYDATAADLAADLVGDDAGFGFGGASRAEDITSLQLGLALGMLPLLEPAQTKEIGKALASLETDGFLDGYASGVRAPLATVIRSAAAGLLDADAYLGVMQAAARGLADAPDAAGQRFHGYLLVGLWGGTALVCADSTCNAELMANTGRTLAMLLEEDAAFGGSDRALAGHVGRLVAALTRATDAPLERGEVLAILDAMRRLEHDAA